MNISQNWLDSARLATVADVAARLGLTPGKPAAGRQTWSCPSCGAATRHTRTSDRRGAIGTTADGLGWRCFQCNAAGDGIDMAAFSVGGARFRDLPQHERARVRDWFVEHGGDPGPACARPAPRPPRAAPRQDPPRYLARDEVEALWTACRPVAGDAEVSRYLDGRALYPETIADLDLARSLSRDADLPPWARGPGGPWTTTGHRLFVPLRDSSGSMRSCIARSVTGSTRFPKSLAPARHERRGLVMCDSLACQLLETGARPGWWDPDVPLSVVITEGEIDFLTWTTTSEAASDLAHGPAVIGVVQGSWIAEIAARLEGAGVCDVVIATDLDDAGEELAARIIRTWTDGVRVQRWTT